MNKEDLKARAAELGLPTTGTKPSLIKSIADFFLKDEDAEAKAQAEEDIAKAEAGDVKPLTRQI